MKTNEKKTGGALKPLPVMLFQPDIAKNKEIGLNGAIVIQQVHYWAEQNRDNGRNFYNGRYWVYNSIKDWQENNFPFWEFSTVKRTIAKLEKLGVLLSTTQQGGGKTKAYAVDYEQLSALVGVSYDEK